MSEMYAAIESNDIGSLRRIVSAHPAAVNVVEEGAFYSPLAYAVRNVDRTYEVIEFLVRNGADVNWVTVDGYSPLHLNVDLNGPSGSGELPYKVARLLKLRGANVEARNGYDWTPLMRATLEGTTDEFAALLDIGASYAVKYSEKSMPYFTRGEPLEKIALPYPEKTALLLKYGMRPNKVLLSSAEELILEAGDPNSDYVSFIRESVRLLVSAGAS